MQPRPQSAADRRTGSRRVIAALGAVVLLLAAVVRPASAGVIIITADEAGNGTFKTEFNDGTSTTEKLKTLGPIGKFGLLYLFPIGFSVKGGVVVLKELPDYKENSDVIDFPIIDKPNMGVPIGNAPGFYFYSAKDDNRNALADVGLPEIPKGAVSSNEGIDYIAAKDNPGYSALAVIFVWKSDEPAAGPAPIPEPATLTLSGVGFASLCCYGCIRRRFRWFTIRDALRYFHDSLRRRLQSASVFQKEVG